MQAKESWGQEGCQVYLALQGRYPPLQASLTIITALSIPVYQLFAGSHAILHLSQQHTISAVRSHH